MPCPHKKKALKVLLGELEGAASTRMLQHCRVCGECREAFDFAASTIRSTSGSHDRPAAARVTAEDEGPRGWGVPRKFQAGRNRRVLLAFAVIACALLVAGVGRGRVGAAASEDVPAARWKRALGEGTPIVESPAGSFDGRPRVVTALVPPGSSSFVLTFFDDAGRVVLGREVKPGHAGCFVEPTEIASPAGSFRASRLVAPFPDAEALRLDPGRAWGIAVAVAGGHASASSVFQIATPALQDRASEER